jgi:hypothetical protein
MSDKLSRAQKRVLRALIGETRIMVDSQGHWWSRWPWWVGGHARKGLRPNTLRSLESRGLLKRDPECRQVNFDFVLTPKGRAKAEELQGDPQAS